MRTKIVFLSENPPLKTKGSGISVLLYNVVQAVRSEYLLKIVTFNKEATATLAEISSDNDGIEVTVVDRACSRLYRWARTTKRQLVVEFLAFVLHWPALYFKHNRRDTAIITFVGASIQPVVKAWFLMVMLRRAIHVLYIVDDLAGINKRYGNRVEIVLSKVFLERTIRKADGLLTVSEGLGQLYRQDFQKNSAVLLPHFQKIPALAHPSDNHSSDNHERDSFTFLFTGGLNILYNDALKFFSEALTQINQASGHAKTFKLLIQTYSSREAFDSLGFDTSCVSYSTSTSRQHLTQIYATCDCFVIPYSFAADRRTLVTTSFPQKLAEIVQYGKKILVFAPDYSSLAQFFSTNALVHSCLEYSVSALDESISQVVALPHQQTDYDAAYQKHLSAENVSRVISRAIA